MERLGIEHNAGGAKHVPDPTGEVVYFDQVKELATLMKAMRDKQREYFRTRSSDVLNESKQLEKQVDRAVSEILEPNQQPGLFDDLDLFA